MEFEHYFKNVKHLNIIDVYRILDLYEIKSSGVAHAIKKLLVAGGRGHKDFVIDIKEAIKSLNRVLDMYEEDFPSSSEDEDEKVEINGKLIDSKYAEYYAQCQSNLDNLEKSPIKHDSKNLDLSYQSKFGLDYRYNSNTTNTRRIWGVQQEIGTPASPYIPPDNLDSKYNDVDSVSNFHKKDKELISALIEKIKLEKGNGWEKEQIQHLVEEFNNHLKKQIDLVYYRDVNNFILNCFPTRKEVNEFVQKCPEESLFSAAKKIYIANVQNMKYGLKK